MNHLGLYRHELEIAVIEDGNPATLIVQDTSRYFEDPGFPMLDVRLPGSEHVHTIPVTVGQQTVVNGYLTGLGGYVPMPDGIYQLRYSVSPNEAVFVCLAYLKTDELRCRLDAYLASLNLCDEQVVRKAADLDSQVAVLLAAGGVHARQGRFDLSTQLYRKASQLVDRAKPC